MKEFLPYTKTGFSERMKSVLSKCQIPNCGCKDFYNKLPETLDTFDKELVDSLYHSCALRHHNKCQLLHR